MLGDSGLRPSEASAPSAAQPGVRARAAGWLRRFGPVGLFLLWPALASVAGSRDEQLEEAADLVFHLLVLLQSKGIAFSEVARLLEKRHLISKN